MNITMSSVQLIVHIIAYLALARQLGIGLVTAETFRHSDTGSKIGSDKIPFIDTTAHTHVLAFRPSE